MIYLSKQFARLDLNTLVALAGEMGIALDGTKRQRPGTSIARSLKSQRSTKRKTRKSLRRPAAH